MSDFGGLGFVQVLQSTMTKNLRSPPRCERPDGMRMWGQGRGLADARHGG